MFEISEDNNKRKEAKEKKESDPNPYALSDITDTLICIKSDVVELKNDVKWIKKLIWVIISTLFGSLLVVLIGNLL